MTNIDVRLDFCVALPVDQQRSVVVTGTREDASEAEHKGE